MRWRVPRGEYWRWFVQGLISALLVLHVTGWLPISALTRLDGWWYDVRLTLAHPVSVDDRVVVVDIDERSLAQLGQWPWPRATVAALLNTLGQHYRVGVIGLDVVFAEPGDNPLVERLAALARRQPLPELAGLLRDARQDAQLAQALRQNPVVMGYYFDTSGQGALRTGALPEPVFDVAVAPDVQALAASGFGANLVALQQAAAAAGHFNSWADADGVNRRIPLLVGYQGNYYDTLALAMLRRLSGAEPVLPVFAESGQLQALSVGKMVFPLGRHATIPVPYVGPARSFPYYSAADVLAKRIDPARLQGRLVLVGTTAPGLMDLRVTPFGQVYPGVEIHANLLNAALQGALYAEPDVSGWLLLAVLLLGVLLPWLFNRCSPMMAGGLTLCLLAVLVLSNWWWWQQHLAVPVTVPVLQVVMLYLVHAIWGFVSEARRRRELSSVFGSYIPSVLVDRMADAPEQFLAQMQGERREMTVLFSDVRNFTRISEGMAPEALAAMMNAYLSAQTRHVQQTQGTIDKYIGDAIMAFWGAPLADPDHAQHAVHSAMTMVETLTGLNAEFSRRGWPQLSIGIGLNSGPMTVGNMGSDFRRAYTVLGDEVNQAARLEGLTKQYGVPILCGERTRLACADVCWREVDRVRVKGKSRDVTIWQPLPAGTPAVAQLEQWGRALAMYRRGEFMAADQELARLVAEAPEDGLYQAFRQRVAGLIAKPPMQWDGIFEQTEK
ncbi:adenylate/guanylate cyclase domain-containing protein [Vogesella sp. LYT5W]|uniref:Adenylate/guanylate cyclase domain-containing protein n=1 Tax=Vogesella margarita TaxID=2984199 RepID=A0ABT5IM83_9NEIS|nr:adenylate/guanylate cyclase domain-containing protein [Vogesella margarita]MDC7713638.1 adenylate/guanylate cyclase domain-containing protein [Vogesella margarita]